MLWIFFYVYWHVVSKVSFDLSRLYHAGGSNQTKGRGRREGKEKGGRIRRNVWMGEEKQRGEKRKGYKKKLKSWNSPCWTSVRKCPLEAEDTAQKLSPSLQKKEVWLPAPGSGSSRLSVALVPLHPAPSSGWINTDTYPHNAHTTHKWILKTFVCMVNRRESIY